MFPALSTVSFDAVLPFSCVHSEGVMPLLRWQHEARLLLRILTAPAISQDDDDGQTRLEAKLDLSVYLQLLAQLDPNLPDCACRVGMEEIAWQSAEENWGVGDCVVATLLLDPQWPLPVHLPLVIIEKTIDIETSRPVFCGRIVAEFWDEPLQAVWEKWVFSRHRQSIRRPPSRT
ncbi:hypothetical protein [Aquaspirillum serpens]|uniref:hypothetical protein n=1 Tax=Aquaspirillum serpens TaxID=190 RepID=UPI0003B546BF|nr:hypothetical protein [Aquaspirillum serpens]